jgi:hypothetical protein
VYGLAAGLEHTERDHLCLGANEGLEPVVGAATNSAGMVCSSSNQEMTHAMALQRRVMARACACERSSKALDTCLALGDFRTKLDSCSSAKRSSIGTDVSARSV